MSLKYCTYCNIASCWGITHFTQKKYVAMVRSWTSGQARSQDFVQDGASLVQAQCTPYQN